MKKITAGLVSLILAVFISTSAIAAAPPETVQPMWDNVFSVSPTMYASTGEYASEIFAVSGTTKIECTLILSEETSPNSNVFVEKSRLNETYYGNCHVFRGKYAIKSGVRYKLETIASVTRNGYTESINVPWIKKC